VAVVSHGARSYGPSRAAPARPPAPPRGRSLRGLLPGLPARRGQPNLSAGGSTAAGSPPGGLGHRPARHAVRAPGVVGHRVRPVRAGPRRGGIGQRRGGLVGHVRMPGGGGGGPVARGSPSRRAPRLGVQLDPEEPGAPRRARRPDRWCRPRGTGRTPCRRAGIRRARHGGPARPASRAGSSPSWSSRQSRAHPDRRRVEAPGPTTARGTEGQLFGSCRPSSATQSREAPRR
jgi:hypothetical protein